MEKKEINCRYYELIPPLSVKEFGRIARVNRHPDRTMNMWTLGVVVEGKRTIRVGKDRICAAAGEYFLLPPGIPHFGMEVEQHDVYYFHFQIRSLQAEKEQKSAKGMIRLPLWGKLSAEVDLTGLIMVLYRDYRLSYLTDDILGLHLLSILHILSMDDRKNQYGKKKEHVLAEHLLQWILENLPYKLESAAFEQKFRMSYRRLNSIFKKRYGCTIHQCVLERKIQYAAHLLIMGDDIALAAAKCGFEDYFYFLKVFKKIKGITPKRYKDFYLDGRITAVDRQFPC